jgi:uncharacterized membrane protein YkvA (DUF1232 family)
MSDNDDRKIVSSKGGVFNEFTNYFKLVVRLMGDKRVNPLLKLLPIGTLVYFVVPDIVPGPIDDAVIVWLGTYMFVELCPPDVVQEHSEALDRVVPGEWHDSQDSIVEEENKSVDEEDRIVDAEFWDKE